MTSEQQISSTLRLHRRRTAVEITQRPIPGFSMMKVNQIRAGRWTHHRCLSDIFHSHHCSVYSKNIRYANFRVGFALGTAVREAEVFDVQSRLQCGRVAKTLVPVSAHHFLVRIKMRCRIDKTSTLEEIQNVLELPTTYSCTQSEKLKNNQKNN